VVRFDFTAGWPGVFRPLRHYVADDARRLRLGDRWVYFAVCDSPCWPPDESKPELPLCVNCWSARQRFVSPDTEGSGHGQSIGGQSARLRTEVGVLVGPDRDLSIVLLNSPEAGHAEPG
jgi:hypothetical protein